MPLSVTVRSDIITITGIDEPAAVAVSGGEYSLNCSGPFVSTPGTITNNARICVRHTSAAVNCGVTDTILTIGGVTDTFSSTTITTGIDYFDISGSTAVAENACPAWVGQLQGDDCSYNASNPTGSGTEQWIGPVFSAGYYAPGSAPLTFSNDPVLAPVTAPAAQLPLGGKSGIPITRGFLSINDNCTANDPSDDVITGTLEFGAFERNVALGPTQRVVERFDRVIHRLLNGRVTAASANAQGGIDYIVGSTGDGTSLYPSLITGGTTAHGGFSDDFPSEVASQSSDSPTDVPYWNAPGTGGIAGFEGETAVRGGRTGASVWGYSCDSESGSCPSSPIRWAWDQPAGFENVLLRFSTTAGGALTALEGFLVQTTDESTSITGNDSWQATTVTASGGRDLTPDAFDDRGILIQGLDLSVIFQPLENDVPGATPAVIEIASQPTHGTAALVEGANNFLEYVPNPGDTFQGIDTFTYRIRDANNATAVGTIAVTITDPVACVADEASGGRNTPSVVPVLANDIGANLPPITLTISEPPTAGSAVVNEDNTITFTPPPDTGGLFTFRYSVAEATFEPPASGCLVTVRVDNLPVAVDDTASLEAGVAGTIAVLANDTGLTDTPITLTIVEPPAHGTATVVPGTGTALPTISYTSDPGYTGADSFRYEITDGNGDRSNVASVAVTVQDSVPVAVADSATVEDGIATTIDVLANDSGLIDRPVTISFPARPTHGTVVVVPGSGAALPTVTYTSEPGYVGTDSFRYRVTDADGDQSNGATVTVTVQDSAPIAVNDAAVVPDNTSRLVQVLENDTGLTDRPLLIALPQKPAHGTVLVLGDGVFYTPDRDYVGQDSFGYRVTDADGDRSNVATVTLDIRNTVPNAVADTATAEDGVATVINVLANDTGLDESPLAVTLVGAADHGTVEIVSSGAAGRPAVRYTSTPGYTGPDSFRYRVTDADGDPSNVASVAVTVTDSVPVAVNDTASAENSAATLINVLGNDSNLVDTPLTVTFPEQPAHGAVTIVSAPQTGLPVVSYTVSGGYTGTDSFRYRLTDGDGDRSNAATVTITVTDSIPSAVSDTATAQDGVATRIPVLRNDSGLANAPLSLAFVTRPAHGTVRVVTDPDSGDPAVSYTAVAGFAGSDSFSYRITDADGDQSNVATVSITVTDASVPAAVDDAAVVEDGVPTSIDVLANDTGLADVPLRISFPTGPAHGTAEAVTDLVTGRLQVRYTAAAGYAGADGFSYRITDGEGDRSNVATVSLTVQDSVLVAVADESTVSDGVATAINVLNNDLGLAERPLRIGIVEQPQHGTVEDLTDPQTGLPAISYTAEAGYSGPDSLRYRITDGDGDHSNATTVTIDVQDSAPVAVADSQTVEDGVPDLIDVLFNDTGLDDTPLRVTIPRRPAHGTAEIIDDPDFGLPIIGYTADAGYDGPDSFSYRVEDADGDLSETATVAITVRDSVPVAVDDIASGDVRGPARRRLEVLRNDEELEDTPIKLQIEVGPAHGTAEVVTDPATGEHYIAYGSEKGFIGTDTLRYRVADADGDRSALATVAITVADATPVAVDDTLNLEDEVGGTIDVLANDLGLANRPLALTIVRPPTHGTAEVIPAADASSDVPTIRYRPNAGYTGSDSLDYRFTDGDDERSNVATVGIGVRDTVPVANFDSANGDARELTAVDVLANDTGLLDEPLAVEITGAPAHGKAEIVTVVVNATQTRPGISYASDLDFAGTDSVRYRIRDGDGDLSAEATLLLDIANPVPFAADDTTAAQPALGIAAGQATERLQTPIDVLANDTGRGNRPLTIIITQAPAHGTVAIDSAEVTGLGRPGVRYRSDEGYTGPDSFRYVVRDADGERSNEATVAFTVVNILTAVTDGSPTPVRTTRDRPVNIAVLENDGGLANGPPITVEIVAEVNGTAVVNADNTVTFTPAAGFIGRFPAPDCQPPACVATGGGGFRYKITDASNRSVETGVFVDVFPAAVTEQDDGGSSTLDPAWFMLLAIADRLRRRRRVCPGPESNRHDPCGSTDFKSVASTSSATRASPVEASGG